MVTQIQLGNLFTSGGRTIINSAGGSGLDTESIVKSLTEAKRVPATQLEDKISLNNKRKDALTEYRKKLTTLKDAVNFLRNPPGVSNASSDIFRYASVNLSASNGVAASNYLSVTAQPGASLQNYTINQIETLAAAKRQRTGNFTVADTTTVSVVKTSPAAGEFKAGTFTLKGKNITLDEGDSLSEVAAKFNAQSASTNIRADVIKVSDGIYQLAFSATKTGEDVDFDLKNIDVPGTVVDGSGVLSQITVSLSQAASNAKFRLNGVDIERQQNTISDAIDGLSFTLASTTITSPTTISLNVVPDESIAKSGITNFVNAYNDLRLFSVKQQQVGTDGLYTEGSLLASNVNFRSTINQINQEASNIVRGVIGTNPTRLTEIGLSFADSPETTDNPLVRNVLNIDDSKLSTALSENYEGIKNLFGFNFVSDNANLRVFSRTNALSATNFTLNINNNPTALGVNPITYTEGGKTVNITQTAHGLTTGDYVTLTGLTGSVNGISGNEANTRYKVTVVDANNYTVDLYNESLSKNPLATDGTTGKLTLSVPNHNFQVGEYIKVSGVSAAVGGIAANQINDIAYKIDSITADTVTFTTSGTSNSAVSSEGGSGIKVSVVAAPQTLSTDALSTDGTTGQITIAATGHNFVAGQKIKISGAADIGGITAGQINDIEFTIDSVGANTITFTTAGTSTSAEATGGGAALKIFAVTGGGASVGASEDVYTATVGGATVELNVTSLTGARGFSITGKTGTVLEGLQLVYVDTKAATISVSATQGIADRLYNISDDVLKDTIGSLDLDIAAIESENTRLKDSVTKIDSQIEDYRQQLLDKFSRLEQAIARTNTLLQSIDANNNALNNSN